MSQIIFSFIIPHRNIPNLLARCVNSIPRRSDSEIIIVDDNSNEESLFYLQNIESQYNNVFVIRLLQAKGAGAARNVGIDHAKGKWLLFIDADDFFYPCIGNIMDKYIDSRIDIIYFLSDSRFSNDINRMAKKSDGMMSVILTYEKNPQKYEMFLRFKYAVPWGKMIRADLVKNKAIRYDEVLAGNDVLFSAKTGFYASTICVENLVAYCITERTDSIVRQETIQYIDARFESRIHLMQFLRSVGYPEYRHPIGELIIQYRKFGIKQFLQKVLYVVNSGYGIKFLCLDVLKNILCYPKRKLIYVFSK